MRRSDFSLSAVLVSSLLLQSACGGGDQKNERDGAVGESLTISSVSPDQGPLAGGTTITITGDNLDDMTGMVLVGDRVATDVMYLDDSTISAVVPANTRAGAVDVTVFSASGYGVAGDAFSYNPLPGIDDVQPRFGRTGETLTLTGSGFAEFNPGDTTIKIGDTECSSPTVVNDTTATCVAGEQAPSYEPQDVRLVNDNGEASFQAFAFRGPGLFVFLSRQATIDTQVFFVDPVAAEPTFHLVGELDTPMHKPVLAGNDRYLSRGQDSNSQTLFTIDMDRLTTTATGTLASSPRITDLAADGARLMALRQSNNNTPPPVPLAIIDQTTGSATELSVPPGTELATRMHGMIRTAPGTFLAVRQRNSPVVQIVVDTNNIATVTNLFTEDGIGSERLRDITTFDGRIFGVREGGAGLAPPPGGGGNRPTTLVEIDPNAQTISDIAILPPESHSLVEVN